MRECMIPPCARLMHNTYRVIMVIRSFSLVPPHRPTFDAVQQTHVNYVGFLLGILYTKTQTQI